MALAITARSSLPVTLFMNRNRTLVAANRRATAGSIGRRMPGIAISSPAWSQPQVRGRPPQFPREVDQPNTMAMAYCRHHEDQEFGAMHNDAKAARRTPGG